ncbi:hypothetical protein CPB83DRAFT_858246 [Crepidotus variabilis]|uniref:ATPase inhibitor, mitochondrial n=1 Tax=Crepidotus variabilis TaxID=179855 RepID=A0A9P6EC32_9AGAR|nr:hypothetical protein CPB83DRAFT_858246 [Crepidotus variabilis]
MLSRLVAVRRAPRVFLAPARSYSDSRKEGSVASSKGFSAKEKAHEDQYIHQHELEKIAKLKASMEADRKALEEIEKNIADKAKK